MKDCSLLKLNEIKLLFDSGALKTCIVHRNEMLNEIQYWISVVGKNHEVVLLRTQRKTVETRYFKNINSAMNAVENIGFRKFEVILSS